MLAAPQAPMQERRLLHSNNAPKAIILSPDCFYKGERFCRLCVVLRAVWGFTLRRLCCFGGKARGAGHNPVPAGRTVEATQHNTAGQTCFLPDGEL